VGYKDVPGISSSVYILADSAGHDFYHDNLVHRGGAGLRVLDSKRDNIADTRGRNRFPAIPLAAQLAILTADYLAQTISGHEEKNKADAGRGINKGLFHADNRIHIRHARAIIVVRREALLRGHVA